MLNLDKIKGGQIISLTKKITSKKYGYAPAQAVVEHYADLLDCEVMYDGKISCNDKPLIIYLNNDYFGGKALNLYDGLHDIIYNSLNSIIENDNVYSLIYKIPEGFIESLSNRLNNPSTYHKFNEEFVAKAQEKLRNITVIEPNNIPSESILYGDSHGVTVVSSGTPYNKLMGKTLYSVTKNNLLKEYAIDSNRKKIEFMFGSVDIRHHLCRTDNGYKSLDGILKKYIEDCEWILSNTEVEEVTIHCPTPIEPEARRIPKGTYYKDTPFYGSREDRAKLTLYFIQELEAIAKPGILIKTYPKHWYELDPVQYELLLEKHQGAHVSWKYSRINDFGQKKLKELKI